MSYPPPQAAMLVLANDEEHGDLHAWAEGHIGTNDGEYDKRLADWLHALRYPTPFGANGPRNYPLNEPIPYVLVDQVDELLCDWGEVLSAHNQPLNSHIVYAVEV